MTSTSLHLCSDVLRYGLDGGQHTVAIAFDGRGKLVGRSYPANAGVSSGWHQTPRYRDERDVLLELQEFSPLRE